MKNESLPSLSDLIFSAKIDYLSLDVLQRKPNPSTAGRIYWPQTHHSKRLTIHDPTAADIALIEAAYPNGKLAELEVAVDVRPKACIPESERSHMLTAFKAEYVAKGLKPRFREDLNSGFRGAYRRTPTGYALHPFNRRVPAAGEQLLLGHRNDGVQVKVYLKTTDHGRQLPLKQQCVRMEVRLGASGLKAHHLLGITDFKCFAFRHELMPYFQHVHGSRRRVSRSSGKVNAPMLALLAGYLDNVDARYWDSVGVGAFLRGGRRVSNDLLFQRHTAMNNRIGQALHRLQSAFAAKELVCAHPSAPEESSTTTGACGNLTRSAMTYPIGSMSPIDPDDQFDELKRILDDQPN